MRIGAFSFDSSVAVLAERPSLPGKILKGESIEKLLRSQGCCVLENVKSGVWIAGNFQVNFYTWIVRLYLKWICQHIISLVFNLFHLFIVVKFSDLQLVRCPVCDLNTCDGNLNTIPRALHIPNPFVLPLPSNLDKTNNAPVNLHH